MQTEPSPPAPAVVAVVVTCDAGPWLEEVLTALASTDYPNLSVLVVDAGSAVDPTPVVAGVMPGAFVRRLERRCAFGTAANEVLDIVEGASHFLFLHDDVAVAPDAVRLLVEEAFRSNAGVASPKYVEWDQPDRLIAVGLSTDKSGARRNMVEPGELDQAQHDAVRDVLVAPGGATLVRADLFSALGGFDRVVDEFGEDLDLSWRALLAGARVIVVPSARVRHLQATVRDQRIQTRFRPSHLADSNRHRTLLTCYRWYNLAWIIPIALFWALGEALTQAVEGRLGEATTTLAALARAWREPGQLRASRRRVQRGRRVGDRALRDLQVRGNARLRAFIQVRFDEMRSGFSLIVPPVALSDEPDLDADGRVVAPPTVRRRSNRGSGRALVPLILAIVVVFGSRSLLGRELPQIGLLPDTSAGWSALWSGWWSGWQPGGLGAPGPGAPALALLGLLDTVLFGAVGTLQHLVVLGPLLVGPLGAYRAARAWESRRGRMVAAVAYAVLPLPYNALAAGRWDGLVAYAAMPWLLASLTRLSGLVPVAPTEFRRLGGRVVALGILVAMASAVAPVLIYVTPAVGLALALGSALVGQWRSMRRLVGVTLAASMVAVVLLAPWSFSVVGHGAVVGVPSLGPAGRLGLGSVMRFHTGPWGSGGWEWLILAAAALPLLVGRGWRLEWAARMWVVTLASFGVAWASRRGWLPALPLEVLLAPAGAALAGSAALGAAAFELDLPGYNFGWRQVAAAAAGACLLLAAVPWFAASGNGRWRLPSADASSILPPPGAPGDYRVLWVGDPRALPMASRTFSAGVAYAASFDGQPGPADVWLSGQAGATPVLADDLRLAENHLTTKLGHLLAPAGVRYVVVPNHTGPSSSGSSAVPVPGPVLAGLALQTDMRAIPVDPNYTVYVNAAAAPVRGVLPEAAAGLVGPGFSVDRLQQADLGGSPAVLQGTSAASVSGPVPPATVYVGSTRSDGWRLDVPGRSVRAAPAFGWGMAFDLSRSGSSSVHGHLHYTPSLIERAGYLIGMAAWAVAIITVGMDRRRRGIAAGRPGWKETVDDDWFTPAQTPPRRRPSAAHRGGRARGRKSWTAPGGGRPRPPRRASPDQRSADRGRPSGGARSGAAQSDEAWIDV